MAASGDRLAVRPLALLLFFLISTAAAGSDAPAKPTVTYLGNEGVLLEAGGHKVLIDALVGPGLPHYPAPEGDLREALETASGRFADVDLVLAGHHHQDHFDAAAVARHLRANPEAVFVSTDEAVERLLREIGSGEAAQPLRDRIRAVDPAEGEPLEVPLHPAGLRLTVWDLHHGRNRRPPVPNLGLLVELNGFRVLHVGDTEAVTDEIAGLGWADRSIDLALLPYWKVRGKAGESFRRAIGARHVRAFHLPRPTAPASWFGSDGDLNGLVDALERISGLRPLHRIGRGEEY